MSKESKVPIKPRIPKVKSKSKTSWIRKIPWRRILFVLGSVWVVGTFVWVLFFRWVNPPMTGLMLKRSYEYYIEYDRFRIIHPAWVDYEEISPNYIRALVAGEDQKFVGHFGFDFAAIYAASEWNGKHKRIRGASTITQQVAKNVFLWENRSWLRKLLEVWFTILIELLWSKERILEVHANVAELGPWTFGIQNASEYAFHKEAVNLNNREAALIAASLPKPRLFNAQNPRAFYLNKQSFILRYMNQMQIPK